MTLRELLKEDPTIKIAVRWGNNGRKYIIHTDTATKKQLDYEVEQVCDGVAWLWR